MTPSLFRKLPLTNTAKYQALAKNPNLAELIAAWRLIKFELSPSLSGRNEGAGDSNCAESIPVLFGIKYGHVNRPEFHKLCHSETLEEWREQIPALPTEAQIKEATTMLRMQIRQRLPEPYRTAPQAAEEKEESA